MPESQKPLRPKPVTDIPVTGSVGGAAANLRQELNRTLPPPNWDLWANMPTVALWQAVALSMPLEPEAVQWDRNGWMVGDSDVLTIDDAATFPNGEDAVQFRSRYKLLKTCYWHPPFTGPVATSPLHRSPVKLIEFVRWASKQPLYAPLPERLLGLVPPQSKAPAYVSSRTVTAPNWDKWKHMPKLPLWKAVCLSFSWDPHEGMFGGGIRTHGRFSPGLPALQDRLEILMANLSTNGPIRPQPPLYQGMMQSPECSVLLSDIAAFLTDRGMEVPAEMGALAAVGQLDSAPAQETKDHREDRRLRMCEDRGLTMNKDALLRMPDGISKVAEAEGVTRQAFTEDVKNALKRKLHRERDGSGSR